MTEKKKLQAMLNALTDDEVANVAKWAGARLSQAGLGAPTAEAALSSPELFVLASLADYVKRAGLGFEGVERLRAASGFPAFRQKIAPLMAFIEKQRCKNQNEKRLLLLFGFELIHEDITRLEIAADARSLMNHVHRMPAVFDSNFPGYGAQGYLGMIVQRRVKGVNEDED